MNRLTALLAFLAFLVAGCASSSPQPTPPPISTQAPSQGPATGSPPISSLPPSLTLPFTAEWTSCAGAGALAYGSQDAPGLAVPPGWEKDWPVNGIYYDMFECERMSIGPFERGPVHGVIEQFSDATPPPECTKGTYTQDVMMANWWIDDADIAAYLAGLGMPVHFANVTVEQTDGAGASVYTWRWQGDGDESWVTFESNNLSYEVFDRVQRIFWFTNSMVGQMDLSMEENYSLPLTGAGQMAPPSIYAFTGSPTPFAPVRGGIYTQLGLSANLRYFGDFECKKPLS